jgi:hypothetical protein
MVHDQVKETWRKIWIAKEESCSSSNSSGEEASKVILARGEDNPESRTGTRS